MGRQTLRVDLDVPDGYELTGEYRAVGAHEFFLDSDNKARQAGSCGHDAMWPVLRKAWDAPTWVPDGAWVYRSGDGWYASWDEPFPFDSSGELFVACQVLFKFVDSFVAPKTVRKFQVKRGN